MVLYPQKNTPGAKTKGDKSVLVKPEILDELSEHNEMIIQVYQFIMQLLNGRRQKGRTHVNYKYTG